MKPLNLLLSLFAITIAASGCGGGSKDSNPMPVGVVTASPGPVASSPSSSAPGVTPSPTASAKSTAPSGGATTPPATSMATPVSQINVVGVYPYPTADGAGTGSLCMSALANHNLVYVVTQSATNWFFETFNPTSGTFTDAAFPSGGETYNYPGESFSPQQCLVTVGSGVATSYTNSNDQDGILSYNNGSPVGTLSSGTAVSGTAIQGSGTTIYRLGTANESCQLFAQNAANGSVSSTPVATLIPTGTGGSNNNCTFAFGTDTAGDVAIVAGYLNANPSTGSFTLITPAGVATVHPGQFTPGSPLVYGPDGNFWYENSLSEPTRVTPQGVASTVNVTDATEEAPYAVYRGLHNDLLFSAAVGLIDYIPSNGMQSLVTLVGPGSSTANNDQLSAAVIGTDGYLYAEEFTETSGANANLLKLSY